MATMIPDPPFDFHGSRGEQAVYESLRTLGAHVVVLHSLRWIRTPGHDPGASQGEGDFLVFDPERGVLVIEVKSGGIRCAAGRWYQRNRANNVELLMQDPEAQADRTRHALISRFRDGLPKGAVCPVYHAVWFPSVQFPKASLPSQLHRKMVLDADDLEAPEPAIEEAFAFGSGRPTHALLEPRDRRKVLELLAPTIYAVPSIRQAVDARDRTFVRLTGEQARVLDFLEEQDRAVVAGAAGTGKTMVGLALARRLADAGDDVVFLCFNAPLRTYLENHHHAPRLTFHTFDSLAAAHSPELAGDFEAAKGALVDVLSTSSAPTFTHVIIDEGQDFEDEWLEALAANTTRTFYVFYDANQLVHQERVPTWIEQADCRLVLRRNCRTTNQISRFAYRLAPRPIALGPDTVDGPKPRLHACETREQAATRAAELLHRHLSDGTYAPHEMALVSMVPPASSLLGLFEQIGGYPVAEVPRPGAITYSSVRRFKGLEAKLVVLVDVAAGHLVDTRARSLLYVGASRAMQELHVVLHDATRDQLAVAARAFADSGRKANAHALASALGATWAEENVNDQVVVQ
jgi:NAD(P)-dependent dehydrogenase (short-subunit alcohol dehydrogenase family)